MHVNNTHIKSNLRRKLFFLGASNILPRMYAIWKEQYVCVTQFFPVGVVVFVESVSKRQRVVFFRTDFL